MNVFKLFKYLATMSRYLQAEEVEARCRGSRAYKKGLGHEANPYLPRKNRENPMVNLVKATWWREGWTSARDTRLGAEEDAAREV